VSLTDYRPKTFETIVTTAKALQCLKLNFYSTTMKVVSVALSLAFAAGSIQTAVADLRCESQCAACWKIGSPGIDLKMICQQGHCGETCPEGYTDMHCAKSRRCAYVDLSMTYFFPSKSMSSGLTKRSQIGVG